MLASSAARPGSRRVGAFEARRWSPAGTRGRARPSRTAAPDCRRPARTAGARRSPCGRRIKAREAGRKGRSRRSTCPCCAFRASIRAAWPTIDRAGARTAARLGLPGRGRADDHARRDDAARDRRAARSADHRPSEIDRMDTVGAWIVYRTVRDRGAKVIGASRDEVSLLKQVARVRRAGAGPSRRAGTASSASSRELGEWVAEAGHDAGRPARLLRRDPDRLRQRHPPAAGASASTPSSSASTWSASARSGSSA